MPRLNDVTGLCPRPVDGLPDLIGQEVSCDFVEVLFAGLLNNFNEWTADSLLSSYLDKDRQQRQPTDDGGRQDQTDC